eukprot:symbB.v1.2.028072.t1/scaffold2936.1/size66856/1
MLWLVLVLASQRVGGNGSCGEAEVDCTVPRDPSDALGLLQGVSGVPRRASAKQRSLQPASGLTQIRTSSDPDFGPNVIVVPAGAADPELQAKLNKLYNDYIGWDDEGQFGQHRTAVFLMPGDHEVDIQLPYYFQVLGLGASPTETVVRPGTGGIGLKVGRQPGNLPNTNTFWRSIENCEVPSNLDFFVSQAAPLRKVKVHGNLQLSGNGTDWTSGGALANSEILGQIITGTQQQWYTRGTKMNAYTHPAGLGSYAAVGCVDLNDALFTVSYDFSGNHQQWQTGHTGETYTEPPAVFAEKPFIMIEEGKYKLRIPEVLNNHAGYDWQSGSTVGFEEVFVTTQNTTAKDINSAIAQGLHVVITPAVYYLEEPIVINHPNICILGLGFATLIPQKLDIFIGRGVIEVGAVDGVRLAGVFVQAGPLDSPNYANAVGALVRWGDPNNPYEGNKENPGFIYDFIARVGGPDFVPVGVDTMLEVNNGWVITDNTWLWKADHCVNSSGALCIPQRYVKHCLVVNSANVHMYGLMAEHSNGDIVVWNGEYGKTYFFQSELKYTMGELSKPNSWDNVSHPVSYRVNAVNHIALAMGIYCVVLAQDVDNEAVPMANIDQQGGFSAIAVKHSDAYSWGFKDVAALNWNMQWPTNSRLTCKAWTEESDPQCLDLTVSPPR